MLTTTEEHSPSDKPDAEELGHDLEKLKQLGVQLPDEVMAELGRQGIVPKRGGGPADDSSYYMTRSLKFGLRGYYGLFASLIALLLVNVGGFFRWLGLGLSACFLLAALVSFGIEFRLYGKYKQACRREGIPRRTLWNRPLPRWMRQ